MHRTRVFVVASGFLLSVAAAVAAVSLAPSIQGGGQGGDMPATLSATVVATGIPGAGAITQVGTFHKGGPFAPGGALAAASHPVLDRTRLLVASSSNFGAPLLRPTEAPGSILSLDVTQGAVAVPADFARPDLGPPTIATGQPYAAGGAVILYTAQSGPFRNGLNNPSAVTADLPSVSLPLGISLNNGFGRPWFANAPLGAAGPGTISVVDPSGIGLAGAPSAAAGGVFAGNLTNRSLTPPVAHPGLGGAAVATALATKSPDLVIPQRAVFFAALADGSVAQVHVQKGVDPLVPASSFAPLPVVTTAAAESTDPDTATRVGMIFNWAPTRILYVSDPLANRILAVDISEEGLVPDPNGRLSASNLRYIRSPHFDVPIDIAPVMSEVAARNFASSTTLGAGSDIYVLNRGNNTLVRLTQDGRIVAIRQIAAPLAAFRANGLAVSEDARLIWVTATTPDHGGVVLQMTAFGAAPVTTSLIEHAIGAGANGAIAQGTDMFGVELTAEQSLGPLFNGQSCVTCHNKAGGADFTGGMGTSEASFVRRVARTTPAGFNPLLGMGGPIARQRSIAELGVPCGLPTGDPPQANRVSRRSAMTLRGTALIDSIRPADIERVRVAQPADVRGRFNILPGGRFGKFGWKAQTSTLVEFMGEALRDEMGITNPLAPLDLVSGCGASIVRPEADAVPLTSLVAFLNTIDPPTAAAECRASAGADVFRTIGCANCHTPSLPAHGNATPVFLYSDLLLHDMGAALADGFEQGTALGNEFRTAPLWRLADREHFLHDGRARTIDEAIRAHGGQAAGSAADAAALGPVNQGALLDFLRCI